MPTPTPTALLTPQELYDAMMQVIEPDLMTENVRTLDAKYAGETPVERRERFYHYAVSLDICRNAIERFGNELEEDMKDLIAAMTRHVQAEDEKKLQQLEDSLHQFPSDHAS